VDLRQTFACVRRSHDTSINVHKLISDKHRCVPDVSQLFARGATGTEQLHFFSAGWKQSETDSHEESLLLTGKLDILCHGDALAPLASVATTASRVKIRILGQP
jgi:hypothetical protein